MIYDIFKCEIDRQLLASFQSTDLDPADILDLDIFDGDVNELMDSNKTDRSRSHSPHLAHDRV